MQGKSHYKYSRNGTSCSIEHIWMLHQTRTTLLHSLSCNLYDCSAVWVVKKGSSAIATCISCGFLQPFHVLFLTKRFKYGECACTTAMSFKLWRGKAVQLLGACLGIFLQLFHVLFLATRLRYYGDCACTTATPFELWRGEAVLLLHACLWVFCSIFMFYF